MEKQLELPDLTLARRKIPVLRIGYQPQSPMGAEEALAASGGAEITSHPTWCELDGENEMLPRHAVYSQWGTNRQFIGVVAPNRYNHLPPRAVARAWDTATGGKPVESIGLKNTGETMFLSSFIRQFDIGNQPHIVLAVLTAPLNARGAVRLSIQTWRQVCTNGMWGRETGQDWRIPHTSAACLSVLQRCLNTYAGVSEDRARIAQNTLARLTNTDVTEKEAGQVLRTIWPIAQELEVGDPHFDRVYAARQKALEAHLRVFALWRGEATGYDEETMGGTAYGLGQSAIEYLQHETRAKNDNLRAADQLFGVRARQTVAVWDAVGHLR